MVDFSNRYWGSNVPCDVPPPRDVEVEHSCPNCDAIWVVIMNKEFGNLFYYDEDNELCPKCGTVGEIF